MKILKWSFISLGIVVVLIFLFFLFALIIPGMPTTGEKIGEYENSGRALLVIDLQEAFTGRFAKPGLRYPDFDKYVNTVNRVIKKASAKGMKVIYIRQIFDGFLGTLVSKLFLEGSALEGTPGAATGSAKRSWSSPAPPARTPV